MNWPIIWTIMYPRAHQSKKVKIKLGAYTRLRVVSPFISVTLSFVPVVGKNSLS